MERQLPPLSDLRLGRGEQLWQKWREEGTGKSLAWSLHPPPKAAPASRKTQKGGGIKAETGVCSGKV